MESEILEKVKRFVEQERWEYDFPLLATTTVEYDLGITGADAIEFMVAYGKHFNVDVSKFMAGDYFDAEGNNIFAMSNPNNKKTLRLEHLVKGILAGKLDEDVIEIP